MRQVNRFIKKIQDSIFESIVSSRLVYNTCWEDPRIDRELLQLNEQSSVVMITSAGDNALDYLLDSPAEIYAIDQNPYQNALLELKLALFDLGERELLLSYFMKGKFKDAIHIYYQYLRRFLPDYARIIWDDNIYAFVRGPAQESFYYTGTSGKFAWLVRQYIRNQNLQNPIDLLLNADSLEKQEELYYKIEPRLWSVFNEWAINQNAAMALIGVPPNQKNIIERNFPGGLKQFIKKSLYNTFTQLTTRDNYFWRVYLTGTYVPHCTPNYLKKEHFEAICRQRESLQIYNEKICEFLTRNPGSYSHYVLLDHMDWLAWKDFEALKKEWELILKNSFSGTRILFRSAGLTHDFLPKFVLDAVEFKSDLTKSLHRKDRVGTYGSTHLAIVE